LTLAQGPNQIRFSRREAGQVYRQSVTVTPTADGVLFAGLDRIAQARRNDRIAGVFLPLIVER